jgi:hypothetical protein
MQISSGNQGELLVIVSVFYPVWNRPIEQVACQKPVQIATQLHIG